MTYYYFAATLPSLRMDEPPPIPMGSFLASCRQHLSGRDLAALDRLLSDPFDADSTDAYVYAWVNLVRQVRNAVARHRASRLQRDPAPYFRAHEGLDVSVETAVGEAFQKPSPLDREHALDALLWERAGELAGCDPFSRDAVLAYALRLRIAERWSALKDEMGMSNVRTRATARPAGASGA
jgi:hypothetical protein